MKGHTTSARPRTRSRRSLLFIVLAATLGVVFSALIGAWIAAPRVERAARERLIRALEDEFDSSVEIDRLDVSLYPQFEQIGEGIRLRLHGRRDVPPLITFSRYVARTDWSSLLLQRPRRIDHLGVESLQIVMPPRERRRGQPNDGPGGCTQPGPLDLGRHYGEIPSPEPVLLLRDMTADAARLELLPRNPAKRPRIFDIHRLRLGSVAPEQAFEFRAVLTNPAPEGLIDTSGRFGPWSKESPSLTPLSGEYAFQDADLSRFKGISGTLSSTGRYEGVLEQVYVTGNTDVPDFQLSVSDSPTRLATAFVACVDGTDGDTYLRRVEARFRQTALLASGKVEGHADKPGRTIALDVKIDKGRVEDLILLAVKGNRPFLTGGVQLGASFVLPPGEEDVARRIELAGRFLISGGTFTDRDVQRKIDELSRRGRGAVEESAGTLAPSDFEGQFRLANGVMRFARLQFSVRGAIVRLAGRYDLESETLDFEGTLRLQATVSQTTTGVKSLLLKVIDPLFKHDDAGAVIPIAITGTRSKPEFKVQVMRALLRRVR